MDAIQITETKLKLLHNEQLVREYLRILFPSTQHHTPTEREIAKQSAMKDKRWIKLL